MCMRLIQNHSLLHILRGIFCEEPERIGDATRFCRELKSGRDTDESREVRDILSLICKLFTKNLMSHTNTHTMH